MRIARLVALLALASCGTQVAGTTATGYGVYGYSASSDGVHGETTSADSAVAGINTGGGRGVYGKISGGNGGAAIFGDDSATGGTHWAGNFQGNVIIDRNGSLFFGGNCYAGHCNSDQRLKQNIAPLTGALDTLLQLVGVHYEWIRPDEHGGQVGPQNGFIAQQVEQVFPAWVGEDQKGFKTLNIPPLQFAALEVESMRELKAENDALKAETAALRAKTASLEERLDALEQATRGGSRR